MKDVTARSMAIGLLCVLATVYLVTEAEVVMSTVRIGYLQLPPISVAILLALVTIKNSLGKAARRFGLTSSEMLVIYCMTLVAAMVSSHGIVEKLVPGLVALNYFGNTSNNWHGLYDRWIQHRLVPYDPARSGVQTVSEQYYNGLPHGAEIPWQLWVVPILNWGFLVCLVMVSFFCLAAIVRKQWVENEKLTFPLAQLPVALVSVGELTESGRKLMWLGAAVPIIVFGLKYLHQLQPQIPDIPTYYVLNDSLPAPWNSLAYIPLCISFAAIGFFYLLPSEILFSIWFFFILTRLEQAVAIQYGIETPGMPSMPTLLFTGYQTVGAYLVMVCYLAYTARHHLANLWAAAIGRKPSDKDELLPPRLAVFGLLICVAASAVWLKLMGMSLWLAAFEVVVYVFVIAVVMARSTAEAGMLMTETTFRPVDLLRMVTPLSALGPTNLTLLAFCDNLFTRDLRGLVLTGFLDGAKISDDTTVTRRSFAKIFGVSISLAFVAAVALNLFFAYHKGANLMDQYTEAASPTSFWNSYSVYVTSTKIPWTDRSWQIPAGFATGMVVQAFLTFMRMTFYWWPIHPIGYVLAGSWTTTVFWFPCLIAWLCKSLSLRYGGLSFFLKARPFFLGMVAGEFLAAVVSVILSILFHTTPPAFPWA